ncbi:MAG: Na+/H+ antiporter NhaC family protein, partial [Gemmatimonadetes bacterium]|nr:Na+/H+ antiporter NhaC family protein [Gemmatimonadota bacterium]NIQ57621.1 Na+/H+ antiporter NhaC family protein [Gemmatimonadota bacterium]NIU77792.1 Na+/H+ antiporter NhaC family protein [Gammaproteobacteria bacterium]NIX46921.1 Na+/H+ antiporter NhaC family protein [Gemmatimonadota bacterium]NIY11272.1 Na+/H+ antiporter NhaC family protein [Gemmatimonadota bacterium]
VSPISDTTIASATTQDADLGGVVRSRMRYALPAAAAAVLVFTVAGGGTAGAPPDLTASDEAVGLAMLA